MFKVTKLGSGRARIQAYIVELQALTLMLYHPLVGLFKAKTLSNKRNRYICFKRKLGHKAQRSGPPVVIPIDTGQELMSHLSSRACSTGHWTGSKAVELG